MGNTGDQDYHTLTAFLQYSWPSWMVSLPLLAEIGNKLFSFKPSESWLIQKLVFWSEEIPAQLRTTLTYRPSWHIGGNDNLVLAHSLGTRRSFPCRVWHRINVSLRISSYHSGPAR